MKKVFIQILQWILRHKKRLIYGGLAFFIVQIFFFNLGDMGIGNEVFAAGEQKDTATQNEMFESKAKEDFERLSFIQKIIYVLIYPMLAIAGKLVDNSFVYGGVFNFDTALWELWNMARNLANFTLGFLFVYKIFEFLINGKKSSDIKKLLISSLIAGIGIQASWFIMMALVDLSTIMTYSIGGLPISVLNDGKDVTKENLEHDPYILKNVLYVDVKDIDTTAFYLTNMEVGNGESGNFYIAECKTFTYKYDGDNSEELILAPSMIYYNEGSGVKTTMSTSDDGNRCHYGGQVYYFSRLYDGLKEKSLCADLTGCRDMQVKYDAALSDSSAKIVGLGVDIVREFINDGILLEVGDSHTSLDGKIGTKLYGSGEKIGLDVDNERTGEGGKTQRLHDLLDGKSYVGVFTLLYSSLLDSGKNIIPTDAGTFGNLLGIALSLGHVIAIGIPLIAVAIVFMIRIGILRVAIGLSPFIALFSAFKDIGDKVFKSDFLQYFKLENLIWIIFSPAIICFAISLSTVLVKIIVNLGFDRVEQGNKDILGGRRRRTYRIKDKNGFLQCD